MAQQGIEVIQQGDPTAVMKVDDAPMAIEVLKARSAVRNFVLGEMVDGYHYGQTGGPRSAKALMEPGAEYLCEAFKIAWQPEIVDKYEDYERHIYRYKVAAMRIVPNPHAPGEIIRISGWVASASSSEKRFQGETDKTMLPDLVLDKAVKRAYVNMTRNATGTSGEFMKAYDDDAGEGTGTAAPTARIQNESRSVTNGGSSQAPTGDPDDILQVCPTHGVDWQRKESDYGPDYMSHREDTLSPPWCKFGKLLRDRLEGLAKEMGVMPKQNEVWIGRLNDRPWSKLSPEEQLAALRLRQEDLKAHKAKAAGQAETTEIPAGAVRTAQDPAATTEATDETGLFPEK